MRSTVTCKMKREWQQARGGGRQPGDGSRGHFFERIDGGVVIRRSAGYAGWDFCSSKTCARRGGSTRMRIRFIRTSSRLLDPSKASSFCCAFGNTQCTHACMRGTLADLTGSTAYTHAHACNNAHTHPYTERRRTTPMCRSLLMRKAGSPSSSS